MDTASSSTPRARRITSCTGPTSRTSRPRSFARSTQPLPKPAHRPHRPEHRRLAHHQNRELRPTRRRNQTRRLEMQLRIAEIMRILPHRYPFLLVDRVIEVDPDKRIVALKNVSINEPFFNGHFPGAPVMPGVLTIESMAQAGAILGLLERKPEELKNT